MEVESYMTPDPQVVSVDGTVGDAAAAMWNGDFGVVPIVDGDLHVVAMLTDRDICMAAHTQCRPLHEIPVRGAMSRTVVAVHPSDAVTRAEALMRDHQVRRLPVVDALGKLVGIVSLADLARPAAMTVGKNGLSARDVTQTLGRICEPPPKPPVAVAG